MVTMIMMMVLLLPSAMHCGNFARFSSFLNKGTITSSTKAQNCSDDETSKGWWNIQGWWITQWVWMNIAACHVVEQLQLCKIGRDWLLPSFNKINSFVPDKETKSSILWAQSFDKVKSFVPDQEVKSSFVWVKGSSCISRNRGCYSSQYHNLTYIEASFCASYVKVGGYQCMSSVFKDHAWAVLASLCESGVDPRCFEILSGSVGCLGTRKGTLAFAFYDGNIEPWSRKDSRCRRCSSDITFKVS